jgi:hypothetical protein
MTATFPTSLGHAAFWPAHYPEGSCFCGHIPTLFWLVETARPATVLGLGLRTGDGYFALCQAIAGLGIQSLAWGFGAWDGSVPEPLRQHNSQNYAGFSRVTQMDSVFEAASRFESGLFDLILLDGRGLDAEDPKALAEVLLPLASGRGMIFVQSVGLQKSNTPPATMTVLLSGLAARHPVLRFDAQSDCALILIGTDPRPHLMALTQAAAPAQEIAALDRLGSSHLLVWNAREQAQKQAAQDAELARCRHEAKDLQARLADQDTQLGNMNGYLTESRNLRLRDVRVLTAQLEHLAEQIRQTGLEADAAVAQVRLEMQAAAEEAMAALRIRHFDENTDLQSEIFALRQDLSKAQGEASTARKSVAETQARAAALTADLGTLQAAHGAAKTAHHTQTNSLRQQIAGFEQTIAFLQSQIAALRHEASKREAVHRVQVKLHDWKQRRIDEKPRFGGPPGPSGGKLADEVTAVASHPLFDADWYLSAYPDTQGSALSAAEHFVRHGFYEGRDPGPRLRLVDWFIAHPNALAERKNPLLDPNLAP